MSYCNTLKAKIQALKLAAKGYHVFPCKAKAKTPRITGWPDAATTDPATIRTWFDRWPSANVAIATGARSGVVVLDLDRHGDVDGVAAAEALGWEQAGPIVRTPGGGIHAYYRHPGGYVKGSASKIAPGVDLQGDGKYVIAPPSNHPAGGRYEWEDEDEPLPELPDWCMNAPESPGAHDGKAGDLLTADVPKGQRNDAAARVAGKLLQDNPTTAWAALTGWNVLHCRPPLDLDELRTVYDSICRAEADGKGKVTVSQKLAELAEKAVTRYTHTADGATYALIPESRPLRMNARGGRFAPWLRAAYRQAHGKPARGGDVSDLTSALVGRALFDGKPERVYTRVAEHEGRVYLDLGRQDTAAVQITSTGWELIDRPPIMFATSEALSALPEPVHGGSLDRLVELLNMRPEDALMATAWLLGTLQPDRPFPVLLLTGAAGSGKSTRSRVLRYLVDPAGPDGSLVSSPPREPRDVFAAASASHVLSIDNLSNVPGWLSDLLSSVATGGGLTSRRLYTDNDVSVIQARNPIMLNGIGVSGLGADLIDRAICVTCPPLDAIRAESDLWADCRRAAPEILGALLDAAVVALRDRDSVKIPAGRRPRMLDFARWVVAAEPELQKVWPGVSFLDVYETNRKTASADMLEASELGRLLVRMDHFEGTASDLKMALEAKIRNGNDYDTANYLLHEKGWPTSAARFGIILTRLVPQLAACGVFLRKNSRRVWKLERA